MFGFRSDKSAEDSGRPGADICHGYLSLDSVLETKLQQFCQPLLQGLEDRPKSRTWQLERSLATPMGPEWHREMMAFGHQLLNPQLLKADNRQLHKVSLLRNKREYTGDPVDLAPGVFATLVFLSVAPGQGVQFEVTNQNPSPQLAFAKRNCHSVCCAIIQAGCRYKLQVDGDCMAVVHDLKQDTMTAWQEAAAADNQLWYRRHLSKCVVQDHNLGSERWMYIFDQKYQYQEKGLSVESLSKQQQSAASSMHVAAHTGLLDVVLVYITQTEEFLIIDDQEALLKQSATLDGWKRLDGTCLSWACTDFKPHQDFMLQANDYLDKLTIDSETRSDGTASRVIRTKERAAYMMWPSSNRWAVFCQHQGTDGALSTLQEMIQDLQLPRSANDYPDAADATDISQGSCLPKYAPFAISRHEISQLFSVVWPSRFDAWPCVPETRTWLPTEALVKDLALIRTKHKLKKADLGLETAYELIKAAKLLGWLRLTPILQKMASNLIDRVAQLPQQHDYFHPHPDSPPAAVKAVAEACEAVLLLLGHQNVVMQVLLYNIVFSLSSAFVQYCQLNCTVFPTGKPTPQSRHEPAECQVCKSLLGTHVVTLFARVFERMRADVGTAPGYVVCLSQGIEQAHTRLINLYQTHSGIFQLSHVTPPVHSNPRSVVSYAGSPDMIKLLATCAYMKNQHAISLRCRLHFSLCKSCQAMRQAYESANKTAWHLSQNSMGAKVFEQVVIELFSGMNPPHRTIADVQDDSLSGRW